MTEYHKYLCGEVSKIYEEFLKHKGEKLLLKNGIEISPDLVTFLTSTTPEGQFQN